MRSWTNDETFNFIDLYRKETSIWNPKDANHKDKSKVNDAWNRISNVMDVSVIDLKKKKETLMSSFRLHLKKKMASINSGASSEEIYQPIWVFYDVLEEFLKDNYEYNSVLNAEEVVNIEGSTIPETKPTIKKCYENLPESNAGNIELLPAFPETKPVTKKRRYATLPESDEGNKVVATFPEARPAVKKRRYENLPESDEVSPEMNKTFLTLNDTLRKKLEDTSDDECDLYGKLIAKKLRHFNQIEREELMYEIDGMLLRKRRSSNQLYFQLISPSDGRISPSDSLLTSHHESNASAGGSRS